MVNQSEYMDKFWDYVGQHQDGRDPMRRAWESVERDLENELGVRRYGSYHSFRTGKWKRPRRIRLTIITVCHPKMR